MGKVKDKVGAHSVRSGRREGFSVEAMVQRGRRRKPEHFWGPVSELSGLTGDRERALRVSSGGDQVTPEHGRRTGTVSSSLHISAA